MKNKSDTALLDKPAAADTQPARVSLVPIAPDDEAKGVANESGADDDHQHEGEIARAKEVMTQLKLLSRDNFEQAFIRGKLLNEWEEKRLYKRVRHRTKDEVLDRVGIRPATAHSDQRVAAKFDLETVRHLGIGKVRLLAANFFDDPMAIVYGGLEVPGESGGIEHYSVEEVSYREFQALIKRYRAAKAAHAPAAEAQLQLKIEEVTEAMLQEAEATEAPTGHTIEGAEEVPAAEAIAVEGGTGAQGHKGRRRRRRHGR